MKKLFALCTALALLAALSACGGSPSGANSQAPADTQPSQSAQPAGTGGESGGVITIGASNYTEVYILGNIYKELIESNTDLTVETSFGLNGAVFCFAALENGDIDMFVEYTGTVLSNILNQPMNNDHDAVYETVSTMMQEEHNIHTSAPLGFNNTYVMSVKPETAEEYHLETLSDLMAVADQLRLGCTVEFIQREDCLPLLEETFGTTFEEVSGLDATIRYTAIDSGQVDVVDAFATDALLSKLGLTTLEDDVSFFPPYDACNFVRQEVLDEYPELVPVLSQLDGLFTEASMAALNAQVDVDGMDAEDVAHQFLVDNGLIPE